MKGVVSLPMPKRWYNEKAAAKSDNPIDVNICASKKPYFMIYRYPEHRARYLAFHEAAQDQCVTQFGVPIENIDTVDRTMAVETFLEWYDRLCPVQRSNGVINRICRVCEEYFGSPRSVQVDDQPFSPELLKSGTTYSAYTRSKITTLYHDYMRALKQAGASKMPEDELADYKQVLAEEFMFACTEACPDEDELCDIVVDICYSRENSKQFAWDMCGEHMVNNVLDKTGMTIHYPRAAKQGNILYGGHRFRLETMEVCNEGYSLE